MNSKRKNVESSDTPSLYSIFQGQVATLQPYGAFIKIPGYKKQGLVHKSQMSKSRVEDPSEMLAVGELVYCKVISLEDNKIGLSMKVVNQTTGKDEDSSNVQLSLDERKKRKGGHMERAPIELGAVLDTTCRKCGGHGHLAQDCFHTKGDKVYDLIPEDAAELGEKTEETPSKKRKKKDKKSKKSKKHHHSDSSSDSERVKSHKKKHKKHKHHHKQEKKRRHSHYSTSSSEG